MGYFSDAWAAAGNATNATGKAVVSAANSAANAAGNAAVATKDYLVDNAVAVKDYAVDKSVTGARAAAGKAGELKTPKDTDSAEFKKRQAIREYNALLGQTGTDEPKKGAACIKCLAVGKAKRRNDRHDVIRDAQSAAAKESSPTKKKKILDTADRLRQDMDRVEDAKLAEYTYTANDKSTRPDFLDDVKNQPPPGFKIASADQMAKDLGVDKGELKDIIDSKENPSQKIMIFERDTDVLGPGPKYTVAFRGSTTDKRDWNNNGINELNMEAPHQKNAARLGQFLRDGDSGEPIDSLISATGHSKGGSEAQAFSTAAGTSARVFNPAAFDPQQYGLKPEDMHIDRTIVIARDGKGNEIKDKTDPIYYAQNNWKTKYILKKPVTNGLPRELDYIKPSAPPPPGEKESDTEAHSMLQVIEGLERDKKADEKALTEYAGAKS